MTWLGVLNFVVLQWFGVRLARAFRYVQRNTRVDHVSIMPDGSWSLGGVCRVDRVPDGWRLLRWIVPLTGWWSDFVYLWRRR